MGSLDTAPLNNAIPVPRPICGIYAPPARSCTCRRSSVLFATLAISRLILADACGIPCYGFAMLARMEAFRRLCAAARVAH